MKTGKKKKKIKEKYIKQATLRRMIDINSK